MSDESYSSGLVPAVTVVVGYLGILRVLQQVDVPSGRFGAMYCAISSELPSVSADATIRLVSGLSKMKCHE